MLETKENPVNQKVLEEMYAKGMHLGYSPTSRHPQMSKYIFGTRSGLEIFDLEKTVDCLSVAKEFVKNLGKEKKTILFAGTKKEAMAFSEKAAVEIGMPYVRERWLGGTLTNFSEIKKRINHLIDLKKKMASGELDKYTKKEKSQTDKKIKKLDRYLGGMEGLERMPSAIIVVDPKHEKIGVDEAVCMGIPVVAIMSSDCDPRDINYPVPANDSSSTSIEYFISEIVKAYKEGLAAAQEAATLSPQVAEKAAEIKN
ncbi:MAG: 30S ribosomal protein S2 [Candidatus Terrybacteria bacterium CG10_big_fil_rev_8_21_14_0_10_41_10]|uniref:Small ribosomal subunit protein uS2 n=1 Tax=Candidatus Terrybacteria bacterium CG10_big_fil_rev_8_21_14_0_10_41_10 TaxID=1975026 RepID=A0A2M8LA52_9BACT|nr:MAG: 30S ribosomal protein S2 [Candidatus Terrybacteria bacterium CG10_big_fil_rev_8_21_14_0_10_41_10]